jgi:hypothetical protein
MWALYYVYVVVYVVARIFVPVTPLATQTELAPAVAATAPTSAAALPPAIPPRISAPQPAAPGEPTPESAPQLVTAPVRLVVRGAGAEGVSFRSAPGTGGRLKVLKDGDELTAVGEELQVAGRSWTRVKDANGTEGWVASEFLAAGSASIEPAP